MYLNGILALCHSFHLQGSSNKVNTDMNQFFLKCKDLRRTHVSTFQLLKCVNVHLIGVEEKEFSIHCDPSYKSMIYAGEDEELLAPRYSGIEYKLSLEEQACYQGQVVGIISYKPTGKVQQVYLLVNRFRLLSSTDYLTRALPMRCVQYDVVHQRLTTDCIPIQYIQAPLFIVPALDKGGEFGTQTSGKVEKGTFYVISHRQVDCAMILKYDDFIRKNNTKYSNRRESKSVEYMSFNPFLSIDDMNRIKGMFDVNRKDIDYNTDIIEAYDFQIEDDIDE